MAAGNGRVFISYRRQETAWPARQLYELLAGKFGADKIFKDVDNIAPGDDFVDRLTGAVSACEVLLALIGPQWLDLRDADGNRRIDDPHDFVRLELATALQRGVLVIPILVDGARMPAANTLPAELAPLTRRQAVELNPVGFNTDRLLATLTDVLSGPGGWPVADEPEISRSVSVSPPAGGAASGPTRRDPAVASVPASVVPAASGRETGRRRLVPLLAGVGVLTLGAAVWLVPQLSGTNAPREATPPAVSSPSSSASSGSNGAPGVPTIVAHRGGLEQHQFETQQAMEAAALAGFAVETDVRYTKDGVAVLVHDERATKGLNCGGADVRVSQITWAKLRSTCRSKPTQRDTATYQVPTLDATMEGIAAASPSSWVFVEVKTDQSAAQRKAFLAVFSTYGLTDRLVVTSFERQRLKAIASTDPSTRRMLFVSGTRVAASELAGDRLWGVAVEQDIATASYVAELRKAGLAVMIWAPNDENHWAAAVELKPDLVMTAYPGGYQNWLKGR